MDTTIVSKYTCTENGAIALDTSGSPIVDYFMMYTRSLTKEKSYEYIEKCWEISPEKTVAIIFNGRDRLKGKKEKKVYQYDDMVHSREEAKQHPPLKTGGLIPYNSNKIDKSNLPSLNNGYRKVTSKNKKTAQVQSFRNVDDSNEYVTRYRSRFD
jgi:hypothetical protein